MWLTTNIRRTTLIIVALTVFMLGLITARVNYLSDMYPVVSLVLFVVSGAVLSRRRNGILAALIITSCFLLGFWRGNVYVQKLSLYKGLQKQIVTLEVTAREDAVYSDRKQLIFSSSQISVLEPYQANLVGNIEIEGFGTPMVYRGDRIKVTGKLFPKRGDNLAGVSFAEIEVIHVNTSKIDVLRRNFTAGLQNVLPEPLASFGLGLLIGQRNTLPNYLIEQLTAVGLIHIVAVSGYNLTIIIYASQRLLQKRSRFQALVISGSLIGLFLLFTGYSPSIVRAAVVSGISLIVWYYGRTMKPLMILLLSAVITAGFNPLYVWSSIGWYLSFTAFFGVLVLAPLISQTFIKKAWREKITLQVLAETLAAQLCTLPIILYIFGRLSVVGIVANLLVIPFVPLAMLASLVAGIYGMIGPILFGGLLVLPARILLEYIVSVAGLLSSLPLSSTLVSISALQMVLIYCLIITATILLYLRRHRLLT